MNTSFERGSPRVPFPTVTLTPLMLIRLTPRQLWRLYGATRRIHRATRAQRVFERRAS